MNFFFRRKVDVFARNFQESDEFLCYPTASQFVSASHWQDKEAFFKKMPTNTKIEHAWVYFTIGTCSRLAYRSANSKLESFSLIDCV